MNLSKHTLPVITSTKSLLECTSPQNVPANIVAPNELKHRTLEEGQQPFLEKNDTGPAFPASISRNMRIPHQDVEKDRAAGCAKE